MAPSSCFYMSIHLLFLYLWSHRIGAHNLSRPVKPLCLQDEMSALLQFKERYEIADVSRGPLAHPKTLSWKSTRDCCSWDGIECDESTGHVIVLDLGSSFLYGSIDSNSTLFQLAHLEKLNLSGNHFNYSQIPSRVGDLSRLTLLDLSDSVFSGRVPAEIFKLTRLLHLDLCCNLDPYASTTLLEMKAPGLRSLAQNLTSLEVLRLGVVNMSSEVPNIMANLTSLTCLNMDVCDLHGVFPSAIFNLPKLQILGVADNKALTGQLHDFNSSSPLEVLRLPGISFSGELPASIGNLRSLQMLDLASATCQFSGPLPSSLGKLPSLSYLDMSGCQFSGSLPSFLGNLPSLTSLGLSDCNFSGSIPVSFSNLSNIEQMDLSGNPFTAKTISSLSWVWKNKKLAALSLEDIHLYGEIPPSIGNCTQLQTLSFFGNQLTGAIPSQLMNLTQLTHLFLGANQLTGSISSWLMNMTGLVEVDLASNKFHGEIPSSISQLQNLLALRLVGNNFSGTVELDNFLKLKRLEVLQLSSNKLSCLVSSANVVLPQFEVLGLASCNLSEFPAFLQKQKGMNWLDLSDNNIRGEVPPWVWNNSFNMQYLNLSHNFLTGLHGYYPIYPLLMYTIDLSHNMLKGPPPEAPPSILYYIVSNNSLTGELPPWICNLSSAVTLDFSSNDLTGVLPVCLGNISESLLVLNLKGNSFQGRIPELSVSGTQLTMIDLSNNQLRGKLPRSLANCEMLEFINFANNLIVDTFPSWLGSLPELRVLILRSNKFRGVIERPKSSSMFLKLRILDLSVNALVGKLPMEFFQSWNAMKSKKGNFTYMQRNQQPASYLAFTYYGNYDFSMTVIYKGLKWYYPKISEVFTVMDLSSNLFEGEIPSAIGDLKGLQGLNLSNNLFTGHIPQSLGNLTNLESLDLSQNKLSGQILSRPDSRARDIPCQIATRS